VRRNGDRFQLIAGERRWRAAQKAGLHRVPCIIKEVPEDSVLELSLIENIQREELNPIEEANAFRNLLETRELTQEDLAQRVGKDRSSITNSLRLLKLPSEIQRLVEEEKLTSGHARALLSADSPDEQIAIAREITGRGLSVRETEQIVKKNRPKRHAASNVMNTTEAANIVAAGAKAEQETGGASKDQARRERRGDRNKVLLARGPLPVV
jgi:ParB family chromosome partitioning protein